MAEPFTSEMATVSPEETTDIDPFVLEYMERATPRVRRGIQSILDGSSTEVDFLHKRIGVNGARVIATLLERNNIITKLYLIFN